MAVSTTTPAGSDDAQVAKPKSLLTDEETGASSALSVAGHEFRTLRQPLNENDREDETEPALAASSVVARVIFLPDGSHETVMDTISAGVSHPDPHYFRLHSDGRRKKKLGRERARG